MIVAVLLAALMDVAGDAVPAPSRATVIVARSGADAVIVWNATDAVRALHDVPGQRALQLLERRAVALAAERAHELPHARTITVRVVYRRTATDDERYGAPVTALERLLSVRAGRTVLLQVSGDGALPAGIAVEVTGALPP